MSQRGARGVRGGLGPADRSSDYRALLVASAAFAVPSPVPPRNGLLHGGRWIVSAERQVVLLDGPMGTELSVRGVDTPAPGWSANALEVAPETVMAIHRDYATAGAVVHTTATFRTRPGAVGERWEELAHLAVRLTREAVPEDHLVAGSVAPVEDCYRPDLSPGPKTARKAHSGLCRVLCEAGVDLVLCETFADPREGLIAVECALDTGKETWVAFTPGPGADLLTPRELAAAGASAARKGASAVMVNCVSESKALPYLEALVGAVGDRSVRVGIYPNAGDAGEGLGWGAGPEGAIAFAELAARWVDVGATIIGGCCGTGPGHIAEVRRALTRRGRLGVEISSGGEVLRGAGASRSRRGGAMRR